MSTRGLTKVPKKELAGLKAELSEIGQNLQKRRQEVGWTQEEFAEVMSVSVNSIKYFEQGRRTPSLAMLLRLTKALKLKMVFQKK